MKFGISHLLAGLLRPAWLALAGLIMLAACSPKTTEPPAIRVEKAFARIVPVAGTAAVYFTLYNDGGPDRLIGVSSPDAKIAMVHESREEKGMMRMHARPELEIPAHGEVHFAPGGLHVMLQGVKDAESRRAIVITLHFAGHPDIRVSTPVRPFGTQGS
ncbi:MAG: copper chaperone PCu(A)C [Alphaproteobacteria bacterium]|nr:MAG: copper chaperone PCu(A)C [Alphaproteobacteria bacterium]